MFGLDDKVIIQVDIYSNGFPKNSVGTVVHVAGGVCLVDSGNTEDLRNPYPFFWYEITKVSEE